MLQHVENFKQIKALSIPIKNIYKLYLPIAHPIMNARIQISADYVVGVNQY